MSILSLPVLSVKSKKKKPGVVTQALCRDLANRACKARTLAEAAALIRETALQLPAETDWHKYLLRLADRLARGKPAFTVIVTKGNTKLPFVAFSALPFVTCPGMGECEHFCYSVRAWRYPVGFARQLQNTLLLRFRPSVIRRAFLKVRHGVTFRLYVDGDFDSLKTVRFWMVLLEERQDVSAYGYSKSWRLLWQYGQRYAWPSNYVLNLSSGGRDQGVTAEDMMSLPITRGRFTAVTVDYRPKGVKGNVGFKRYEDPEYHRLVREAAKRAGIARPFSCPGKCGECSPHGHVCGSHKFDDVEVVIGVH
jgi:hypothetical protein